MIIMDEAEAETPISWPSMEGGRRQPLITGFSITISCPLQAYLNPTHSCGTDSVAFFFQMSARVPAAAVKQLGRKQRFPKPGSLRIRQQLVTRHPRQLCRSYTTSLQGNVHSELSIGERKKPAVNNFAEKCAQTDYIAQSSI